MSNGRIFPMADRILGGSLNRRLRQWKDRDGLTIDDVAWKLRNEHGIDVSRETVRRWYLDLGDAA